jgi:hypothetical protein
MNTSSNDRQRTPKPYAERIADLVNMYIINYCGQSSVPLLQALGCRYLKNELGSTTFPIVTPVQPDPSDELLVRSTLLLALRSYANNQMQDIYEAFALVNGLYAQDRWRECLKNPDDAYCLAFLCASLTSSDLDPYFQTGGGTERPCVCLLLNDWLQPDVPFEEPPSISDISHALFGEAWFNFSVEQSGVDFRQVPAVMYLTRPRFIAGLLSEQLEQFEAQSLELPPMADT